MKRRKTKEKKKISKEKYIEKADQERGQKFRFFIYPIFIWSHLSSNI